MERYDLLERIGEGTFGEVYRGRDKASGRIVALKRVVSLLDVFPQASTLVLVFECMVADLHEVILASPRPLSPALVKSYMKALLQGLAHCHANDIMHRDIKPSNLLINAVGDLKLGDFGLARVHRGSGAAPVGISGQDGGTYTPQVATRWYRAPELLFGAKRYGAAVDLWATGAVFAELLAHSPLFPGENDIDQIYRVMQVLGTPTPRIWPGVDALPDFDKIQFPECKPLEWAKVLPNASPQALSLLDRFLVYDPVQRISAAEALRHPYFFTPPPPTHRHSASRRQLHRLSKPSTFAGDLDLAAPFTIPLSTCVPRDAHLLLPHPSYDVHGHSGSGVSSTSSSFANGLASAGAVSAASAPRDAVSSGADGSGGAAGTGTGTGAGTGGGRDGVEVIHYPLASIPRHRPSPIPLQLTSSGFGPQGMAARGARAGAGVGAGAAAANRTGTAGSESASLDTSALDLSLSAASVSSGGGSGSGSVARRSDTPTPAASATVTAPHRSPSASHNTSAAGATAGRSPPRLGDWGPIALASASPSDPFSTRDWLDVM